jgi:hypothetical protein
MRSLARLPFTFCAMVTLEKALWSAAHEKHRVCMIRAKTPLEHESTKSTLVFFAWYILTSSSRKLNNASAPALLNCAKKYFPLFEFILKLLVGVTIPV